MRVFPSSVCRIKFPYCLKRDDACKELYDLNAWFRRSCYGYEYAFPAPELYLAETYLVGVFIRD